MNDETITVGGHRFRLMISEERVQEAIARVAEQLTQHYRDTLPLVICVLNGGGPFHADLIRRMPIPLHVDYIRVSSYGDGIQSGGAITFTAPPGTEIRGRNVIVVDDIVDTGLTAAYLRKYFHQQGAAAVAVATMLFKPEALQTGDRPEFIGIEIPNLFVVGVGLDYAQLGRNLSAIYVLDDAESQKQQTDGTTANLEHTVGSFPNDTLKSQ